MTLFLFIAASWIGLLAHEDWALKEQREHSPPCVVQNEAPAVYVAPYQVKMTKRGHLKRHCERWALDKR